MKYLLYFTILNITFDTRIFTHTKGIYKRHKFRTIIERNSYDKSLNGITLKNCGIKPTKNFISGGRETNSNDIPFIVKLEEWYDLKPRPKWLHRCGATILNEYWILTAAHCFAGWKGEKNKFSVVIGTERYKQSLIIPHKNYDNVEIINDIALFRLDRKIKLNFKFNAICLPSKKFDEPRGDVTIAGWGNTRSIEYEEDNKYHVLRKADLSIISDQRCSNLFAPKRILVFRSYLCAIFRGRGACSGDSGGPAIQYINGRAILVGILSFVADECRGKYPVVMTQVSFYIDWIISKIKDNATDLMDI